MNSQAASARRAHFIGIVGALDHDETARVAVEMYDDTNGLSMALRWMVARGCAAHRAKELMLKHAAVVGYDDSEELVRKLPTHKLKQ